MVLQVTQRECLGAETSIALVPDDSLLLWTRHNVASLLACSTRTLSRMVSAHEIPAPILFVRRPRWRPRDIELWMADGCPSQDRRDPRAKVSLTVVVAPQSLPPIHSKASFNLDSLWTRRDIAQRLQFSPRTISRLWKGQMLPSPRKSGRSPRWRPRDIIEWIDQGCPAVDR